MTATVPGHNSAGADPHAVAQALDACDPLASYRSKFVHANNSDAGVVAYFDGNSLGRPTTGSVERINRFIHEEWGSRLIRSWDEQWMQLPYVIGDAIGRAVIGAAEGQTFVGDSTTVLLYKLARAAVDLDPRRDEVVLDSDNFPTDRYVLEGIARERGLRLVWITADTATGVTVQQVEEALTARTALVVLSHVAYRSGHLADGAAISRLVRDAGAIVLWDLSHSAGSVPVHLDEWGADLAVGCSYKYLNGGPGAPAFAYVRAELQNQLTQPVQGWMGAKDVFAMGPTYEPGPGMRRFASGTPPVFGMLAMQDTIAMIEEVGMASIRQKSLALTEYAIAVSDSWLAPLGVSLASPRDPSQRGGHITLEHPAMREVISWLWERHVIPDYRDPYGLRVGLSPLSTSFEETYSGMLAVRDAVTLVAGGA